MKKLFAFLMLAGMFTACTVKNSEPTKVATDTVAIEVTLVDTANTVAADTTRVDSIAE